MISQHPVTQHYLRLTALWDDERSTFEQIEEQKILFLYATMSNDISENDYRRVVAPLIEIVNQQWEQRIHLFATKPTRKVVGNISSFPGGKHFYVTFRGAGVDIAEKFNTSADANVFREREALRLKTQGYSVIDASRRGE